MDAQRRVRAGLSVLCGEALGGGGEGAPGFPFNIEVTKPDARTENQVPMGNVITVELGLSGLEVIGQEEAGDGEIVVLVQYQRTRMDCPRCKRATGKVHDRRTQGCRDLPLRDRRVRLRVVRRRFRCPRCKVKSRSGRWRPLVFGEAQEAIGQGERGRSRRTTTRLRQGIARRVVHQTVKSAAQDFAVGERFTRECFREWAEGRQTVLAGTPRYLGVDEYSLRKGRRYETVVADLEVRTVLASLPGRDGASLRHWLEALADPWAVEGVAIDMSPAYREAIELCLPAALIVADRFHVVRRVGRALDQVRLRVQRAEGFERKGGLYELRHALLANPEHWTRAEQKGLRQAFKKWPELEGAWRLKEDFRKWYGTEGRARAEEELLAWEDRVLASGILEFMVLMQTEHSMLVGWRDEILAYFDLGLTNGFVEGKNNRTKAIQRQAYGYANPANLRLRILLPKAA